MRRTALGVTFALTALIVACDSEEFGLVGSDMPKEVTQDSLAVPITVTVAEEFSLIPEAGESYLEHDVLVFGQRLRSVVDSLSGWRATPLIRFDMANPVLDDIPLPAVQYWRQVKISLQLYKSDEFFGGSNGDGYNRARDIEVAELNAPLDSLMRDQDIETLLGGVLFTQSDKPNATSYEFSLLTGTSTVPIDTLSAVYQTIRGWMDAGEHNGIAILDRSQAYDKPLSDTLVRFASAEFPRSRSDLLALLNANTIWVPSLVIRFVDPFDLAAEHAQTYKAIEDFTHLGREEPPAGSLRVGTHPDLRTFVRPDLALAAIPTTATINEADLVLRINNEFSLARSSLVVGIYEATAADVVSTELFRLEFIQRASSLVDPMTAQTLAIDVSDFVQRYVNGLVASDQGFLLTTILANEDAVRSIDIFGSTAVDSLRPYLRIRFTPPPDFQE